jgi:hypothetical protein
MQLLFGMRVRRKNDRVAAFKAGKLLDGKVASQL